MRKWVAPELTHLFFSDDGSTAVEVALKLAVQHFSNNGRPEKCEIVALEHGYHGDTAGAMSVSDDSPFTDPFRTDAVSGASCAFGVLLPVPGGTEARNVPHRMRRSNSKGCLPSAEKESRR